MQAAYAIFDDKFGEGDRSAGAIRRHRQLGARLYFRGEFRRGHEGGHAQVSDVCGVLHCRGASAMLGRRCGPSIFQWSRRTPRLRSEFDFPEDQMAFEDRYGLPMSTSSEAAAQAYRHGIDLMLSAWPGAAQAMDIAIETDGEFALAYAARSRNDRTPAEMKHVWRKT